MADVTPVVEQLKKELTELEDQQNQAIAQHDATEKALNTRLADLDAAIAARYAALALLVPPAPKKAAPAKK